MSACQMYDLILGHHKEKFGPGLEEITNNDGLTPLKMAAVEGNTVVCIWKDPVERRHSLLLYCGVAYRHVRFFFPLNRNSDKFFVIRRYSISQK